jgi:hypothetical protein
VIRSKVSLTFLVPLTFSCQTRSQITNLRSEQPNSANSITRKQPTIDSEQLIDQPIKSSQKPLPIPIRDSTKGSATNNQTIHFGSKLPME